MSIWTLRMKHSKVIKWKYELGALESQRRNTNWTKVVKKAVESGDRDLQPKPCEITPTTKDEN